MKTNFQKILSKTYLSIFSNSSTDTSFLSSLLCSLDIQEDTKLESIAATDGLKLYINPDKFISLDQNQRKTVIIHELWHIARLHPLRGKNKDPRAWNLACDIVIDNNLYKDRNKYNYDKPKWFTSNKFDTVNLSEEDIYKKLLDSNQKSENDIFPSGSDKDNIKIVQTVSKAFTISKSFGDGLSDIEMLLSEYLKPKVDWRIALRSFFVEKCELESYTWKKPNRRYQDIYLPSRDEEESKLTHLMYFLDVSGSVSEEEIIQFHSELISIMNDLEPEKLTVAFFDTEILYKEVFTKEHPLTGLKIIHGGGTSYKDVHKMIEEERPLAAVIFTDLFCEPMQKTNIPVLWVCNNNNTHKVNCGKIIRINNTEESI